jgi:hypothetical protein
MPAGCHMRGSQKKNTRAKKRDSNLQIVDTPPMLITAFLVKLKNLRKADQTNGL